MNKNSTNILGSRVDTYNFYESVDKIGQLLDSDSIKYGVTPNSEILLACQNYPKLRTIMNDSAISTPDGAGLLWATKYNSIPLTNIPILRQIQAFWQLLYSSVFFSFNRKYANIITERVTGTDLVPEIARLCADRGKSLYLLGAGPEVASKTAERLVAINPKLVIAGTSSNDWQQEHDEENINNINKSKADCLLIAYGAPRDQYWISRNKEKLESVKFVMGVGGAFDFISGETSMLGGKKASRAPKWMGDMHLEWLHRLFYQPDRIGRIFQAVIVFPIKVMISKQKKPSQ